VGVALESFKSSPGTNPELSALGCFIVVVMLAGSASAAKHPVPLDPKADTSTCLACHEDKTKGKSVHSAMAMGCTSCHEIRVNKGAASEDQAAEQANA
jgi:cytochrome c553